MDFSLKPPECIFFTLSDGMLNRYILQDIMINNRFMSPGTHIGLSVDSSRFTVFATVSLLSILTFLLFLLVLIRGGCRNL